MFRILFISLIFVAGQLVAPGLARAEPDAAARGTFAKACMHYVNRAYFKPRGSQPEFVVTIADSCRAAQRSLDRGDPGERAAAAAFLEAVVRLRDTVIDMNMTRVFGDSYTPFTRIRYATGARSEPVRHVSMFGEYLIAHSMGLIAAYKAWLDTEPEIALALPEGGVANP